MATTANAIAVKVSNESDERQLDEFGRDAAERTVELAPRDAEQVDREVTAGKHQTYDDALHYIIARGLAEIERTRKAALVAFEKTVLKNKKDNWKRMFEQNPSLITNSELVATMMADLGLVNKQATK